MSAQPFAKSVAADGKTELVSIAGQPLLVSAVEFNRLHALNAELLDACKKALYAIKGREHDQFLRDAITKAEAK